MDFETTMGSGNWIQTIDFETKAKPDYTQTSNQAKGPEKSTSTNTSNITTKKICNLWLTCLELWLLPQIWLLDY